jgi:metal-dependent HD superfamily phosphatase/phosphodiesterase
MDVDDREVSPSTDVMEVPVEAPAPPSVTVTGLARLPRLTIRVPARHNRTLQWVIAAVNTDLSLYQLWCSANVNANRLGMSDHGPVHVQVVANVALRLLRLLAMAGIVPNLVRDYGLTQDDAEVVVFLGTLLHDVGMSITRFDHEVFSLIVAQPRIYALLTSSYGEPERTALASEILQTIIAHRAGGRPLTLEAGIVRVADALDMAQGRSRIPYQAGQVNIHSISAAAIERVNIRQGTTKPICIAITMSNSAGIYQIDELLRDKLTGSGLEPFLEVEATIAGTCERKLMEVVRF